MPGTNNLERSAGAHLLAIAATARPSHDNEPIPREAMEAEAKLAAEASPEEIKLILGWLIISAILVGSKITQVKSKQMVGVLRDAVQAIGEGVLNIKVDEIGTHSIRSGAAMAMVMGGLPVYMIMLMGRWSSDAFLRYIRKQIEQFSHDVSTKMIKNMCYRYMPVPTESASNSDPRQRNNPNNAETRRNVGGDATRQARLPAFSLYT